MQNGSKKVAVSVIETISQMRTWLQQYGWENGRAYSENSESFPTQAEHFYGVVDIKDPVGDLELLDFPIFVAVPEEGKLEIRQARAWHDRERTVFVEAEVLKMNSLGDVPNLEEEDG